MAEQRGVEQLNVSFALRLTPKDQHEQILSDADKDETHAIQEVQIGEEHFIMELGRTTVYR